MDTDAGSASSDETPTDQKGGRARELLLVYSGLSAASVGGLFALTQLPPMGNWWVTVATYAFAVGLPMSVGGTLWLGPVAHGDANAEPRDLEVLEIFALWACLVVVAGTMALFGHFHLGAAIAFLVTAVATGVVLGSGSFLSR